MLKRALSTALLATALPLAACTSASDSVEPADIGAPSFVKNGDLAGASHAAVVLILMEEAGVPAFRCTGTLISPTVVLTAGHCTGAPGEFTGMRVFTESDVQNGNNNYPLAGPNSVEATDWHTHPNYTAALFFQNDVGVIRLASPIALPAGQSYGALPALNSLDALKPGPRSSFTAVGYGMQYSSPVASHNVAQKVRMVATPQLISINNGYTGSRSMILSNNTKTGGTCFGDSGGPNYVGSSNVVGGVTSFGKNGTCSGTGGVFRMDRADVLAFVNQYLQ